MPPRGRLIWLPEAVADLQRLRRFIQPKNPDAARRAALQILAGVKILEQHPEAGKPVEDPPGFRDLFIPFGARGYVLRYRLEEPAGGVVIVRVWHGLEQRKHQ
ncbi:MAG: type II toxin-antitoxin system RelE/ParE family toxin [Candidatus Binataceae bacterium]